MKLLGVLNSGRLEYALTHFADEFYPHFYRGLRRAAAAYRREFVAQLGQKEGRFHNFRRKSWPWGFFWKSEPRNERRGDIDDVKVSIFTPSKVAEVLEHGAEIRPRKRRMLAVPIARALNATGRVKREFASPAAAKARGHHVVARWSPSGFLLGVKRKSKRSRFRLMWKLVHRARIEPRLGFYAGWDAFQPEAQRRMDEEADKFWVQFFGQRPKRRAA